MGGNSLPAFVQNGDAAALNKEAAAGTGGESINRISMKQSRFRLIVGGEQVKVFDEPYMDVVIVRTNPNVSKAYYATKYDPNAEDQSPTCYSSNGVVPDPDVADPVCSNCADCPMNVWGSKISDTGSKVKACSDIKRFGIVPSVNVEAPMFQVAVPAGSLKTFGNYIRMLNNTTPPIPYNGVVTRMKFDPDSDYPKVLFEPVGWVTDADYAIIKERYESEEAKRIATIVDAPVDVPRAATARPDDEAAKAAAAKAEAEAKARAEAETKVKAEAEAKAAAEAKARQDEAAAAWGGSATKSEPAAGANPEFEAAGWGNPTEDTKQPPEQAHEEQAAKVVEDGQSIDDVFGPGFDD